jgi:hypothetical protein
VIKYNDNTTKTIVNEDPEQEKLALLLADLPNNSLSLSDLEESNNNSNSSSAPNSSKTGIYIGLTIGGIIVGGILVYFLTRKRKNKNK